MIRIIKVHPDDNVVIPVQDAPKGTRLMPGLVTVRNIPQGHKIAIINLKKGEGVIRYGVCVGRLLEDIPAGGLIDERVLEMPRPPDLNNLPWGKSTFSGTGLSANLPGVFEGYELPGSQFAGVRNILGIMIGVQCAAAVTKAAARKIKDELLPKYPGVDDVTVLSHNYGCGCILEAPGSEIPVRTLKSLIRNPNFGGEFLLVFLGCEKLTADIFLSDKENNSENVIILQETPGFAAMVDRIYSMAEIKLQRLNERKRVSLPLKKLCIGMQCGGSDAFSGVTANPAAGYASDLLVRAGGTVLFSENSEVRDAVQFVSERCASRELSGKLASEMKWFDSYLARGGADTSANPSPGNKAGGLSNIMEKTMGAIAKSGSAPVRGILSMGEMAGGKGASEPDGSCQRGLIFAAAPAGDFHCGTLLLASGATLQVFTTGRGTPYGLAASPVIKVSSRTDLKNLWTDLIDFDAGTIAEGKESITGAGERLYAMIIETASGRYKPFSERNKLFNDLCIFDPAPVT